VAEYSGGRVPLNRLREAAGGKAAASVHGTPDARAGGQWFTEGEAVPRGQEVLR